MQSNQFFATAKPSKLFLRVAIPGMISMLAAAIYSVVEGGFIGQYLGEGAFAAVNLAMPFVMINFSLADLIGVGSSVPISIALGRKDEKTANNYFTCSLLMIVFAGLLMGALLFFSAPLLMDLMGADQALAETAVRYVRIYALLSPITTSVFAMDNYLKISGYVKFSMFLNIFMTCITAGMLFLLLDVVEMDIEGAALSACTSMAFCAFIALLPFLFKKTVFRFVRPIFGFSMVKTIFSCGAPVFLNNIAGRVTAIAMNSALLRIGGESSGQTAVAAYSVMMYAGSILEPLLYGLSDSVSPALGYNWGAKSLERVKAITKLSFLSCGIVSFIGTAVMFFFPEQIALLFVKPEETALLEMSVHAMRLFCVSYLFRWIGFAVQGFYSAIEKPIPATVLSVFSALVFPVLFIFLLIPFGLDGLWLNQAAVAVVVMIMSFIMLRRSQKKMKWYIEHQKEK